MVDTSVNLLFSLNNNNATLMKQKIEVFFYSFNMKYHQKSLPIPDYMFFNMPFVFKLFWDRRHDPRNSSERAEWLKTMQDYRNTWFGHQQIEEVAEYYHMPVLSIGEALNDSAVRNFLNYSSKNEHWKYTADGIHIAAAGAKLAAEYLLAPFFRRVMHSTDNSPRIETPRLYPPLPVLLNIWLYRINYGAVQLNEVAELNPNSSTVWSINEMPKVLCYSSTVKHSVGIVHFNTTLICKNDRGCVVVMGMYHSWNSSYVGNATCSLHKRGVSEPIDRLFINGQAGVGPHTFPIEHNFKEINDAGEYSIRCVNLVEDRLSCMTSLALTQRTIL